LLYEISSKISSISDGCPTGTCNTNHTMYWTELNFSYFLRNLWDNNKKSRGENSTDFSSL
jgi:hypothetical protein